MAWHRLKKRAWHNTNIEKLNENLSRLINSEYHKIILAELIIILLKRQRESSAHGKTIWLYNYPDYNSQGEEQLRSWLKKHCKYFIYAHLRAEIRGYARFMKPIRKQSMVDNVLALGLPIQMKMTACNLDELRPLYLMDQNYIEYNNPDAYKSKDPLAKAFRKNQRKQQLVGPLSKLSFNEDLQIVIFNKDI